MKISSIKIQRLENKNTNLKAIVTVIFDNLVVVRDIKIVDVSNQVFIAMPSVKLLTGEFEEICYPLRQNFKIICKEI